MISCWGFSTATMRSASSPRCGHGSRNSDWSCTRTRPGYWSSEGTRQRTGRNEGRGDPRHSTSWDSRTIAGEPGKAVSDWGASQSRSACDAHCKRSGGKLRKRMHADKVATGKWLGQVLNGWLNYYAVPTSYRSLDQFTIAMKRQWLRTLRRRSQRDRHSWDALEGTVRQTMAPRRGSDTHGRLRDSPLNTRGRSRVP